jgi:hypothetical protein
MEQGMPFSCNTSDPSSRHQNVLLVSDHNARRQALTLHSVQPSFCVPDAGLYLHLLLKHISLKAALTDDVILPDQDELLVTHLELSVHEAKLAVQHLRGTHHSTGC